MAKKRLRTFIVFFVAALFLSRSFWFAKGGEADKVLLMQDLTNAALETFSYDPDELHRLFYTGATRAKRELHVLDPKDFDRAYIL